MKGIVIRCYILQWRTYLKINCNNIFTIKASFRLYPAWDKIVAQSELRANTVLVIRTAEQSAAEVVEQLDRANVLSPGPATIALMQSPKWHFRENRVFLSFLKADVRAFQSAKRL